MTLRACCAQEGAAAPPALAEAAAALAAAQAAYDAELAAAAAPAGDLREPLRRAVERGLQAAAAALQREHAALGEAERETARILNHRRARSDAPAAAWNLLSSVVMWCHMHQPTSALITHVGSRAQRPFALSVPERMSALTLRCPCRGELPEEAAAAYERQRRAFEALQRSAAALAEALDQPLPALPESDVTRTRAAGGVTLVATRVRAARHGLRASGVAHGAEMGFCSRHRACTCKCNADLPDSCAVMPLHGTSDPIA